jgi:hypothetical protein
VRSHIRKAAVVVVVVAVAADRSVAGAGVVGGAGEVGVDGAGSAATTVRSVKATGSWKT